ncbi:NAD(P)-dependent oxidoreductase [Oceanospirillaceae bacterium]|nr:NAD(P)-dependent oxidoreductase [Oceanospirillaceae bacterium]
MVDSYHKIQPLARLSRILLTGGTGFFGRSILRRLLTVRSLGVIGPRVVVLSRSPESFLSNYPEFKDLSWLEFCRGDVLNYASLPTDSRFSHVLHAATESTIGPSLEAIYRYDEIVCGTRNLLDYAVKNNISRFLLTSSGGVYGPQPGSISTIDEAYLGIPDPLDPLSAYSMAKRAAEHLCCLYSDQHGIEVCIARCFSFFGPDLPRTAHFAIGNFVHDALNSHNIVIEGDGSPIRSYMDQDDLADWLLRILDSGTSCEAYNVGSNEAISIHDLAHLVASIFGPNIAVEVLGRSNYLGRNRYVPDISKINKELGLNVSISLRESLSRVAKLTCN